MRDKSKLKTKRSKGKLTAFKLGQSASNLLGPIPRRQQWQRRTTPWVSSTNASFRKNRLLKIKSKTARTSSNKLRSRKWSTVSREFVRLNKFCSSIKTKQKSLIRKYMGLRITQLAI